MVFKAGFEVEAESRDEAVEKAKLELAEEILTVGVSRFVIDVDGKPYPGTVSVVRVRFD